MVLKQFLIAISVGSLVASCQGPSPTNDKRAQELKLNMHSEPPSLDPRKPNDTSSLAVITMCFEGLMRPVVSGQPEFGLAKKVDVSEDGKTYTFYLRDALWSDGHQITASDFEKTWKTMLDPSFPSESVYDLYILKNGKAAKEGKCKLSDVGVKALDATTLQIVLDHPCTYFLDLVTSFNFFATPSHITEKFSNWADNAGSNYVCSGPFRLASWRHNNEIVVEKNPNYWDKDKVILERISLPLIEDENTELNMFERGELDWAGSPLSTLPTDAIKYLKKKGNLITAPISATYFYVFNTKAPPFDNVNVRKAFALAIDRQAIIDNITQTDQIPATGVVPPTMWKDLTIYFKDHDVEEARRLFNLGLKEMGITADELPSITLSYNTMQAHHKIAQAIQEQWIKAFGVRVSLSNKEWKVFLDELSKHQFQVARMGGVAGFNDPSTFFDSYRYENSANNHAQWKNLTFTKLIDDSENTNDPVLRKKILKEAEKILIDEMPIIPIYFYTNSHLKQPYVKGVLLTETNHADFKHAYLEKR